MQNGRKRVEVDDVLEDELAALTYADIPAFGDDDDDKPENAPNNAVELWTQLHQHMKEQRCSRCKIKGHTRSSCWYTNQMNNSARHKGGWFKRHYALVANRIKDLKE